MRTSRSLLLTVSTALVLLLMGGGVAVRLSAEENRYSQPVILAEIVSLVLENYVDPLDPDALVRGAYEGLLSGLDPNSAYLSPEEVSEWRAGGEERRVGPGFAVLKRGRALQVVAVDTDSPAAEAGITVGDQIRAVDGRPTRDLSLAQCRRLLSGAPGTRVALELMRPMEDFRRRELEVERRSRVGSAYRLEVQRGIAVLTVHDLRGVAPAALAAELDDVRSRGVEQLLVDLRNVADDTPPDVAGVAALFIEGGGLQLHDRQGDLLREVPIEGGGRAWPGTVSLLVNGFTAGGGEALAQLLRESRGGEVFGESTFGLGAEPELIELDNGAGLLLSAGLWKTASGGGWNERGISPDEEVAGSGRDFGEQEADQLAKVLDLLEARSTERERPEAA